MPPRSKQDRLINCIIWQQENTCYLCYLVLRRTWTLRIVDSWKPFRFTSSFIFKDPAGGEALLLIGREDTHRHTHISCTETHLKNMKIHKLIRKKICIWSQEENKSRSRRKRRGVRSDLLVTCAHARTCTHQTERERREMEVWLLLSEDPLMGDSIRVRTSEGQREPWGERLGQ